MTEKKCHFSISSGRLAHIRAIGAGAMLLAFVSGCAPSGPVSSPAPQMPGPDATALAVMDADRAFNDYAQDHGVGEAFATFMDKADGKLFRPGNIVTGEAGIRDDFKDWPDNVDLKWDPIGAHGSASGDLGVTWGGYTIERDGQAAGSGHYVTVWRKNSSGEWKGVIDLGVASPPPAQSDSDQKEQQE